MGLVNDENTAEYSQDKDTTTNQAIAKPHCQLVQHIYMGHITSMTKY